MVNPVLTIAFDLFLIGSALVIIGGMVQEYRASRRPSVGLRPAARRSPTASAAGAATKGPTELLAGQRRIAA